MKIVSFNVNGLRSRLHQVEAVIGKYHPDIIGLQETKVQDAEFPAAFLENLGYRVFFHGQKSHYGVALLCRMEPSRVRFGLPGDGDKTQKRFISVTFAAPSGGSLEVINAYFPQGESRDHPVKFPQKRAFYAALLSYLEDFCDPGHDLLVMGDFNIAPGDFDIGIGEDNARRWLKTGKTSFLPEEREWFGKLGQWGLRDSFRELNPETRDLFSWFDYRSRGFERDPRRGLRIDHILMTGGLLEHCLAAGIDYKIRAMEKPSDHCPVWAALEINNN